MTAAKCIDASKLSILLARPEFADLVSNLHGTVFDDVWSSEVFQELIDDPATSILLAADDWPDNIVGFVAGRIAADEGEILSLGVAESYRRHGVASRLVQSIARVLARAGVSNLYLEVASDNVAALNLYTQFRFDEVGRRKGYYVRRGSEACDAVVMATDPRNLSP